MKTRKRVRTIDLENPFAESFEGMCEVLLVRHGEQQFFNNIPLGQAYDAPLSALGQRQAEAVGERLAPARIGRVYASSMRRAHDTANAIARHHGLTPVVVPDLREIDLWQRAPQEKGLLDIYSREQLADIYREVTRTRKHEAYPYCEDVEAFRARVFGAFTRLLMRHRLRVVVAARRCHHAILSSVLGSVFDHLVSVHHTSITVMRAADTRRILLTINDYSHVMEFQKSRGDMNA